MSDPKRLPYEEAAEPVTVQGWRCKRCRQAYVHDSDKQNERLARQCCAESVPCETEGCTNRAVSFHGYCPACDAKREAESFARLTRVPWDGETPMVEYRGDRYLMDQDDVTTYLAERQDSGKALEDVRLMLCAPVDPRYFDVMDYISDDLPEDHESLPGADAINATVNAWIKEAITGVWSWSTTAIDPESLRSLWGEAKAEGGAA